MDPSVVRIIISLKEEINRLKEGRLTPEEFQNLCHNLHERGTPCSREEFAEGCRAFQEKLFGPVARTQE